MDSKEIKILRSCKNWTQEDLAQDLGVKQPFIAQMEKEERPIPQTINKKLHTIKDKIPDETWSNHALRFLLHAALDEPVGRLNKAVEWANPEEVWRAAIDILSKLEKIEKN